MTRVLVVEDGFSSFLLPVVRSFGRAGIPVGLAGPHPRGRSRASRWVAERHVVPSPTDGLDAFADAVGKVVADGSYDVVFGGDDIEVLALSAVRDALPAVVPYPAHDVVVGLVDKLGLTRAAARAGLATPDTVVADDAALAAVDGPVVVKARLHYVPGNDTTHHRLPVATCADAGEAAARAREIRAAGAEPILQERVDGSLMAVTLLLDREGNPVARQQQRALAVSPVLRTSTRAETEPPDEHLVGAVARMLRDAGWFGLANVQLLRRAGRPPVVIDLNPRFYGSIALAIAAGLDLPVWWTSLALGDPVPCGRDARPGVRYQALEEDLRRARRERVGGLARDVVDTVRFARGAAHSTWCRDDVRPSADRMAALVATRGRR